MLTRVEAEHRRVPLDHEGLIADGSSAQKNLLPDRVARICLSAVWISRSKVWEEAVKDQVLLA